MRILLAAACATGLLICNAAAGWAAGAVEDAAYKKGEQFKVIFVSSTEVLDYRVNDQGKLIDLRRITPPLRLAFEVRVVSADTSGVVFEWHQRAGGEQKMGSVWTKRPQPAAALEYRIETRLSRDANHITIANLKKIIGLVNARVEKQISIVPPAHQQAFRKSAMAQLANLNEQTAVVAFAPQSLLLSSGFLAKEVRENRGGETSLSGNTMGNHWTVKFKVAKEKTEGRDNYKWHRDRASKVSSAAIKAQMSKSLPPQMLTHFEKFLKTTISERSFQSGIAIFEGGRPQKISMDERSTSDPLGKEQFRESKLELTFDYTPH